MKKTENASDEARMELSKIIGRLQKIGVDDVKWESLVKAEEKEAGVLIDERKKERISLIQRTLKRKVLKISEQITKGNIIGGDGDSAWATLEALRTDVDEILADTATRREIKEAMDKVEVLLAGVVPTK